MDLARIKLFAFDFDGTLVHSNHIKRQAFYDVVCAHATEPDRVVKTLKNIFTLHPEYNRYQVFSALCAEFQDLDEHVLAGAYTEQCKKLILEAEEVFGASALLNEIKARGSIAVINTATPKEAMKDIIPHMHFGTFIDDVYGDPASKADNLKAAAEQYGLAPQDILMVGDRENDRAAAEEFGCSFVGVRSDLSDFLSPPEYVFDTLEPLTLRLS